MFSLFTLLLGEKAGKGKFVEPMETILLFLLISVGCTTSISSDGEESPLRFDSCKLSLLPTYLIVSMSTC